MTLPNIIDYDHGISAIDSGYYRPGLAAIHLINEGSTVALVDTGTFFSVPGVMEVLCQKNISPENVSYVFLTHIHLDHAGGAGEFMCRFPNAKLVVHPRAARHMVDPSRLIKSTMAVYGEEKFRRMYGEIRPVDASRIVEAADNFHIKMNGRALFFIDTPGHARHHFCIFDERSQSFFTGDTFGVSYREFDVNGMEFVFPTTTPVQFDPLAAHHSLDRIMSYDPQYAFLTHYSRIGNLTHHITMLHDLIDDYVTIASNTYNQRADGNVLLVKELGELLAQRIKLHGCILPQNEIHDLLSMDVNLNAEGLKCWLELNNK
jgi:glyoxylase-like metal-dependent hydrolase (beta-lactamase superfamily II)